MPTYAYRPQGHYVYAYICQITTLPYYIGKGKDSRAWAPHDSIPLPDYYDYIIILEENISDDLACAIETKLIKYYGRRDLQTGILLNKTDGTRNTVTHVDWLSEWQVTENNIPLKVIEYEKKMSIQLTEYSKKRIVKKLKKINHYEKLSQMQVPISLDKCRFPECQNITKLNKNYCCSSHQKKHAGHLAHRHKNKP